MFGAATDDAVIEVAGQLLGVSNAAMRPVLGALIEIDQRELWRRDGAHSTEMWCEMRFGVSHATARSWVRVARGLVYCPTLGQRFDASHLSWDQLVAAIDLVAFGGMSEAAVAEDAVGRTAADLERLAREARRVSRREAEERQRERYLRMRWQRDGMLTINGRLADAEGKAFEVALRRVADDQPVDPSSGLIRPFEERQADALVDLASARLGADADPDVATVVLHLSGEDVVAPDDVDPLASIQLGPLVSGSTALRLCCDGRIQIVIDDAQGATIKVVRTEHAVPRWMRRKVLDRDGGCRWFGCNRQALLHIHHVTFWSRGGLTEESNLVALCPFHHKLVHEHGRTIEGAPAGRLRFVSSQGRVLEGGPPGLREDVREQMWPKWNGDPPLVAA